MKKLFAILLVVAMLLALAGCAGGETSSDNPSNNSNASVSSSDADPIRIGIWTSLTGASAIEGELIENGARLAAAQWNAKGGINGRQIDYWLQPFQLDRCDRQPDRRSGHSLRRQRHRHGMDKVRLPLHFPRHSCQFLHE